MHTEASFDSEAPLPQMWQAAAALHLPAVAVTDHVEMTVFEKEHFADSTAQSVAAVAACRAAFAGQGPRIACGIELGEPLDDLPATEALLAKYPFDFVLGSLHNLSDGLDYYYYDYSDKDLDALLQEYFEHLVRMVQWGKFQSLAHMTYPMRYFPKGRTHRDPACFEVVGDLFSAMAARGIALEINTSSIRKGMGATMPDASLVSLFHRAGGKYVTFGSDSHIPCDVGADLEVAAQVARAAGFSHVAAFFNKEPQLFPL